MSDSFKSFRTWWQTGLNLFQICGRIFSPLVNQYQMLCSYDHAEEKLLVEWMILFRDVEHDDKRGWICSKSVDDYLDPLWISTRCYAHTIKKKIVHPFSAHKHICHFVTGFTQKKNRSSALTRSVARASARQVTLHVISKHTRTSAISFANCAERRF